MTEITPDRWARVKEIFVAAIELEEAERSQWLAQVCQDDPAIQSEVEGLLEFHTPVTRPAPFERPERLREGILLGRGGFSDVYAVTDPEWGPVAIKWLRLHDPASILQFKNEFRLRYQPHPNLVRIYGLVEDGNALLLVMEQLEGETLREALDRRDLALHRIHAILRHLANGLNALHDAQILHRDLKPGNVWLKQDGTAVLLDFGLAAKVDARVYGGNTDVFGTLGYIAPERLQGEPHSEASDWYSLGAILHEMLCGHLPPKGREITFPPEVPEAVAALCKALLHPDPKCRAGREEVARYISAARLPTAAGRLSKPPLIGRDAEFQRLQDCLRKTSRGIPVCVFLSAESGGGKTELAEAFLSSVSSWATTLRGRCYEAESVPFKACDALVDELAVLLQSMPAERREALLPRNMAALERVFPILKGLAKPKPGHLLPSNKEGLRNLAFLALRELIGRLADSRPLVLFLDDLHWGDTDSKPAIEGLLTGSDAPPALILFAWRSENAETGLPGWLRQQAHTFRAEVVEIALNPLSREDAAQLVLALSGNTATVEAASNIADLSAGNPFLIHELTGWEQRFRGIGSNSPESLAEAMQNRVAQISHEARDLLQILTVAGEALPDRVLQLASGIGMAYARAREELLDLRVARSESTGTQKSLDLYHARQRGFLEASIQIDPGTVHSKIATAWIREGDDPQKVYPHLRQSKDTSLCANYAERAAAKAYSMLAFEQAANLYQEAIEWHSADRVPAELYQRLAEAASAAGLGMQAAMSFQKAATLTEQEPEKALSLRILAAGQYLYSGHFSPGLAAFRAVCQDLGVPYPKSDAVLIVSILWLRFRLWLRGLEPRYTAEVPARRRLQMETCWAGLIGTSMIEIIRSASYSSRNLLWALRGDGPERLCRALAAEAAVASSGTVIGIHPLVLLGKAREIDSQVPGSPNSAFIACMAGVVCCNRGEWTKCLRESASALALYDESGSGAGWERVTAMTYWLASKVMTGDWKEVIAAQPDLIAEARRRGDRYAAANLQLLSNYFIAEIGSGCSVDTVERLETLQSDWGQPRFDMQRFCVEMCTIDFLHYERQYRKAWERFQIANSEMRKSELRDMHVLRTRSDFVGARCALALAIETSGTEQAKLLQEAAGYGKWLRRSNQRVGHGIADLIEACIASFRQDWSSAEKQLQRAREIFRETGIQPLAAVSEARFAGSMRHVAWFEAQAISDPEKLSDMFAPGLWSLDRPLPKQ